MQDTPVGTQIRELRQARDWSAEKLAAESGLTASTISRIETGKTVSPAYDVLRQIAKALGFATVDAMLAARPAVERVAHEAATRALATSVIEPNRLSEAELRQIREMIREAVREELGRQWSDQTPS